MVAVVGMIMVVMMVIILPPVLPQCTPGVSHPCDTHDL